MCQLLFFHFFPWFQFSMILKLKSCNCHFLFPFFWVRQYFIFVRKIPLKHWSEEAAADRNCQRTAWKPSELFSRSPHPTSNHLSLACVVVVNVTETFSFQNQKNKQEEAAAEDNDNKRLINASLKVKPSNISLARRRDENWKALLEEGISTSKSWFNLHIFTNTHNKQRPQSKGERKKAT